MSLWGMLNVPAASGLLTLTVTENKDSSLFPLDGARRLRTNVQNDTITTSDFVNDTT